MNHQPTTTKPRLVKVYGSQVWQCRSDAYWSAGPTWQEAWKNWVGYMERHHGY